MSITTQELIAGIEAKNGFPLDPAQQQAISHGNGPLLIAAGPGTGKTEVLVARCLKFMCCDGIAPGSIMLTTFTDKAEKNLQDRLSEAFLFLVNLYPQLSTIDPSDLRIGTLHGLCNDILQEYRYTAYQNLRLLNEVESALLIHKEVVDNVNHLKPVLFSQFSYLFGNRPQNSLGKWDWAFALQKIYDRLIGDSIDLSLMSQAGPSWAALTQAEGIYEQVLSNSHSCDFSRLLLYFREFLDTGQGATFLNGDGTNVRLPLTHVLVDEYQDTNPIQESIYFRLCDTGPNNLTVVGDDDQALYRFRGGTVECMVGFSATCHSRWGGAPHVIYLSENHRSDEDIVKWYDGYITSFPFMAAANVRIAGKPSLNYPLGRTGSHPAVGLIRSTKVSDAAVDFAKLVKSLKDNDVIQDYSQCVLLLRSTRNSSRLAGPYVSALQDESIPIYNPRSRDFLNQDEVAQCLGAFIRIIDPNLIYVNGLLSDNIRQLVQGWIDRYNNLVSNFPDLGNYVAQSAQAILQKPAGERITPATPTIIYRILSHQPFAGYQLNPEMDLRLSKLTRLFESFCSQYGRDLRTDNTNAGQLSNWWFGNFYYGFCGYLEKKGLDDDADDDFVCPAGYFPIMTVHQAKGLEFDFVFVGHLGRSVSASDSHHLESDLRPFRRNQPIVVHPISDAQWHDEVRQHYVAYSRAKYALILVVSDSQLKKTGTETASFGGNGGAWVRQNISRL